jgi:putative ABC transport system permease protein
MNIFTLPVRNLKRKLLRTLILIAVFTVGILSVVMLYNVSETIGHSLEKKMNQYGANILVYPKSDTLNVSYGGFSLGSLSYQVKYMSESETVDKIRNIEFKENISAVAPKLVALADYQGTPLAVTGVVWKEEALIKSYWAVEGKMPEAPDEAIIGQRVSELTGIAAGTKVTVGSGEIVITGILKKTGTEDDNLIFADLHRVQELTAMRDKINFAEVSALCAGCPIEDIVAQIHKGLPDTDINALQNIVKQRMSTIHYVQKLVLLVSAVILVIACFMLSMFMLASVNERKKEIGLLRAVGYSGAKIFIIFGFEALIIGMLAGVFGYLGGYYSSVELLSRLDIDSASGIAFSPILLIICTFSVGLLSVLSAAVPAMKATRVQPTDVFSQI